MQLEPRFIDFANASLDNPPKVNYNNLIDNAPSPQASVFRDESPYVKKPIKINYLEQEQRNLALGIRGEQIAVEYERWRLTNIGKNSFAEKVEWIAQYDDGAGFDILSRNDNGSDRYIEVKTTKLSKETPIFFTKN
ncbi:MAG TPA: DUF3883 domain-containing protein [Saprospiraceae bacterium]|nr:DUF3883 domain-containing protein [Saprospiraceae bacterium]